MTGRPPVDGRALVFYTWAAQLGRLPPRPALVACSMSYESGGGVYLPSSCPLLVGSFSYVRRGAVVPVRYRLLLLLTYPATV